MFPVAAVWSSDGKLVIFDIGASKTITLGPDTLVHTTRIAASFVGPVVAGGELLWAGITPSQAVLLQPGWKRVADVGEDLVQSGILRLKIGATHPDTLVMRTLPAVSAAGFGALPAPRWARPLAAVGFNGHMAVGGFDESYRFLIYDSAGSATRQVCGRGSPLPLTPAEQGVLEGEGMESLSAALREAVAPAEPAAYGRLVVDADARIWVQRERPDPVPGYGLLYGQPGATYDVFDSTGQPVMTGKIPVRAYLLEAKGDTIWTFEIGQYDEVQVVAYQRSRT
jgi:hypothetical protein